MNPDAAELTRKPAGIDLFIKKISDRFVVELDVDGGASLYDKRHVHDEQ